MKNIIKITAALSAVIMLTGCGQRIDETPAEPVQTTAEAVTEATDVTEESSTDTAKVTEKAPEPVKTLTSTEEFFTIFNGADISTGRIADNIDDAIKAVNEDNEVMMITTEGVIIRFAVNTISNLGRITSGVKLMNLSDDIRVASIAKVRGAIIEDSDETESEEVESVEGSEEVKEEQTE